MDEQARVLEARKKLAEKFSNTDIRLGGKGTMKRKMKVVHKAGTGDDKKTKGLIKKLGAQPLNEIVEMNFFTNDNQVMQFKNPEVHGSLQNQTFIVSGNFELNHLKNCFADVLTQLSPAQLEKMKNEIAPSSSTKQDAKEDDAPQLVDFEDAAKKK